MAGVALGDLHLRFTWQAWYLWDWAGSGDALGSPVTPRDAAALCVAGVALGDIRRHFTWQAWRLATSTVALRRRRGTFGTGLALVPLVLPWRRVTPRHFAWQAWRLATSTVVLRGRRGTYGTGMGHGTLRGRRGAWRLRGRRGTW